MIGENTKNNLHIWEEGELWEKIKKHMRTARQIM